MLCFPSTGFFTVEVPPKKPLAGSKLPKKGMILSKPTTVQAFGAISLGLSARLWRWTSHGQQLSLSPRAVRIDYPSESSIPLFEGERGVSLSWRILTEKFKPFDDVIVYYIWTWFMFGTNELKGPLLWSKDCANQIYWWSKFTAQCKAHQVKKGIYLNPETAEHLSGLCVECFKLCVNPKPSLLSLSTVSSCRTPNWVDFQWTQFSQGRYGCCSSMDEELAKPGISS